MRKHRLDMAKIRKETGKAPDTGSGTNTGAAGSEENMDILETNMDNEWKW